MIKDRLKIFWKEGKGLGEEILEWFKVLFYWGSKKTLVLGHLFETGKGFLVRRLLWQRGRLSRPFLHTSFGVILSTGIVAAPIIANTYPTLGLEQRFTEETPSSVLNTQTAATVETTTVESEKPRDKIVTYTVKNGDTLSSIAKQFGISTETITWENNLRNANDLSVGQTLRILPVSGIAHTVKAGETIYSIATRYRLPSAQPIVDFPFNTFRDDETFALNIGDEVIVPDGIKPEERPVLPTRTYIAQVPTNTGGSGAFIWPAFGDLTQERTWYHTGIDIANSGAPDVRASAAGRVIATPREAWGYGWHVIIDHGNYQTLYAHLSRIDVSDGQDVGQGQVIGQMGSTGRSTGTHLHFEVRQGGNILSPRDFLR